MHSSRSQPRSARRSNPRGSSCSRTCSLLRRWPTPLLPGDAPHSTPALHFPWLCIEPFFHMWRHNACRDRLTANEVKYSDRADDPGYVALISHPFFERVARQLLRSSAVHLAEMSVNSRPPSGRPQADAAGQRDAWASGCHIDLQITTTDFNATPRRDLLAIWFWVEDVPAERAAMRILPGSHIPIMDHWERVLTPEQKRQLPRQHGLFPRPSVTYPSFPEFIPEPPEFLYSQCEPMAVAVPANTAQIFTQSMLHSSWHNSDTQPRKGFVISWCDNSVPIGWDTAGQRDQLRDALPRLRRSIAKWKPGREHIALARQQIKHVVSLYEPHWENTFIPGKTAADTPPPRQRL